jgi:DNA-binding NtrC family response regulator
MINKRPIIIEIKKENLMRLLMIGNKFPLWTELCSTIQSFKHEIIEADSCKDGFLKLEKDLDIDAVFIFSASAEDCGLKFLKNLKGDPKLKALPVLIAGTGFEEPLVAEYLKHGAFDIILIPTNSPSLQAKLIRIEMNGRKSALVVDDEKGIAEIIKDYLEMERFKATAVYSAEEALEALRNRHIDIVVSDIILPGKSGMDLLVEIKNNYPEIPVILITGHSGRFSPKDAIQAGADGYFTKPFNNMELSFTIRAIMEKYCPTPRPVKKEIFV